MTERNSVKTPNPEQMVAINHLGGKILSAGAGSGKTYVIIEHIITWLEDLQRRTSAREWANVIPFQLPKLVLMTFTKKAAGEMSIRMMKRIDDLCNLTEGKKEHEFWFIVRQYLSMMNVTTISSFCHQLISAGFFGEIGTNIQILSNVEFKNKISNLYNLWFISKEDSLSQVFQANSSALIGAMVGIYNSPELRMMWKEPMVKTSAERELEKFVKYMIDEFCLAELFSAPIDLTSGPKEKPQKWYQFFENFDQVVKNKGPLSAKNFKDYVLWVNSIERLPPVVKSMNNNQVNTHSRIKTLVKEMRDIQEDLINFIDHYDLYWSWVETFKEVYNFIDHNYFLEKGFAFSDLEYYTCIGLRNPVIREKIKKNYDYFIVDEFQDTSMVQFEIIKHLVGDNHQRLFCVGDKKQAIYGFRGGELLVFNQCIEMLGIENNIWLKNNFRSMGRIVDFNNQFFQKIFPLGVGFEGSDSNVVLMENQSIPSSTIHSGQVEKFKTEIQGLSSDKGLDLDYYEAKALLEILKELLLREDMSSLCVLYRRLRPSALLLDLLAENQIAFSAQVKVQYAEDPVINLFLRSIELKLNSMDPEKLSSTHFLMSKLFEVMQVKARVSEVEKKFLGDLATLGLRLAFHKMLYSLGISNSQYQENSRLVDSICRVCNEDPVKAFHLLSSEGEEEYSMEIMSGTRAKRVVIMSAHASKGLEFDAVLLGGIHSNGIIMGKKDAIGKLPKSFRWKKSYNQKKFFKSPMYYFEADLDKAKDFSENKRLLYVACTRAVRYLGWVDLRATIEGKEEILGIGDGHWIKAMRLIPAEENLITERKLQLDSISFHRDEEIAILLKDSLGINPLDEKGRLGVFAETSVTRLALLSQCPFKFYLSNICKIPSPALDAKIFAKLNEEDLEDAEEVFYSSMARGTKVHASLSKLILNEMCLDDLETGAEKEKISWALDKALKLSEGKNIISERQVKFSLFGQMISGTPDLVFENEKELMVWDFKTGDRDEKNEDSYWFQLMCYAYAYANLKHFTPEKMIPMTLVYLDQKTLVTKERSMEEISRILFENWTKTESLNQVNFKHCLHCDYSPICHHYKRSAH